MKFKAKKGLCCFLLSLALLSSPVTAYAGGGACISGIMYTSQYSTYTDMKKEAELIVFATVKEKDPRYFRGDSGIIFTHYPVEVIEVLKNPNDYPIDDVCMRFTGGEINDYVQMVPETPTLEVGKTYLFVAKKTYPEREEDNDYTPCGAYQGVFKTTIPETKTFNAEPEYDYSKYEITSMNSKNFVELDLTGVTLDKFMKKKK